MCVSPLKGFIVGVNPSGKPRYKITSYSCHHVERPMGSDSLIPCYDSHIGANCSDYYDEWIEIPCGKCIECRLAYSRQWAERMMLEAQQYVENYFVTLTYADVFLKWSSDGYYPTLCKSDVQGFMKRLREAVAPRKIRFYAAGEYGDRTKRPHYHLILFNLHLDDLKIIGYSGKYPLYNSELLSSKWTFGHVVVSPVSWDTCAYTARYVIKKQKGFNNALYDELGIEREFCLMSRRPGLARQYFDENYKKIYECDEVIFGAKDGGHKIKPPRYFDKCLERIDEVWYSIIKEQRRKVAEQAKNTLCSLSRLSYLDILANRGRATEHRINALQRNL